ncbi:hypothetical protein [Butyrivibrio proteoclasticus]|uniref:hypothetical protein n=1 Tax=Butyrivibrio proteoclasticus TaxID=43305 RepID=UPI0004798CFE|nr:hypothetical protein [Butyrivibrio proteoclasticus]
MRKSIKLETIVVIAAVLLLMLTFLMPSNVKVAYASGNSTDSEEQVKIPDPPHPSDVAGQQMQEALVEEGTKVENRSVAGVQSAASGLYLANDVNGVAIQPAQGASLQDTYVTTVDTDANKSSQAMACVNAAAEANGLVVGPSIDIYVKEKADGKLQDGSFEDMGTVSIGLPSNFTGASSYSVVVVVPGGKTEVIPATLAADGKSISVDLSALSDEAKASKQLLISVCKAK